MYMKFPPLVRPRQQPLFASLLETVEWMLSNLPAYLRTFVFDLL